VRLRVHYDREFEETPVDSQKHPSTLCMSSLSEVSLGTLLFGLLFLLSSQKT
jgi:hypothetical protein